MVDLTPCKADRTPCTSAAALDSPAPCSSYLPDRRMLHPWLAPPRVRPGASSRRKLNTTPCTCTPAVWVCGSGLASGRSSGGESALISPHRDRGVSLYVPLSKGTAPCSSHLSDSREILSWSGIGGHDRIRSAVEPHAPVCTAPWLVPVVDLRGGRLPGVMHATADHSPSRATCGLSARRAVGLTLVAARPEDARKRAYGWTVVIHRLHICRGRSWWT
jgi:hypothetical protein